MAYLKIPKGWEIPEREATPEAVFLNRRKFLAAVGIGAIGATGVLPRHLAAADALYPAKRNPAYKLDRPITDEQFATRYNNFYEFTEQKEGVWKLVGDFKPEPWTIEISGLVHKPQKLDLDRLLHRIPLEERLYRHRCVEAWSMAVPWTGFPFKTLIDLVEPKSEAKYIRMVTFLRPAQAPGQRTMRHYPWPYFEGLTMAEARNELAFLVTGMYGHAVPKQNGAPIRLAVPWKYGFKSIKSIVAMEFTSEKPRTFWNDLAPREYGFTANVNPKVPHPRWSQATERVIDTGLMRPTLPYNGYGSFVASLYEKA